MECVRIMYLYKIAVLIEGEEDPMEQYEIDQGICELLKGKCAEYISARVEVVTGVNYGKCVKCGAWVSDYSKKDWIKAFSNGAQVNGKWYCDICLDETHPNSF